MLNQWVVAGPNKEPIDPRTGKSASPTDPSTWGSFEEARRTGYPHVGFVLSVYDPYTIIDLDDPYVRKDKSAIQPEDPDYEEACIRAARHTHILNAFSSYAELSQSGRGLHIIVRGSLPSGVRRDKVEVYSTARYMICTGQAINNLPITDQQELLNIIYSEMASTVSSALEEVPSFLSDSAIVDMASRASNSAKFNALCKGDLNGYPSQSEADFALLTMLCFYTKSNEQVRRLFRLTVLGEREKAQRNDDYINRALSKIRARQAVPLVDLTALVNQPTTQTTTTEEREVEEEEYKPSNLLYPPGLIGNCAEYIYSSATRPVPEVGLMSAIALVAGVVGRSYNISNTGLNQYLMLLAKTGTGKEGAAGGIDALIGSLRPLLPAADEFIGPGTFASGQALIRVLDKRPCFVSVLGEFGLTLQQLCDKNAGSHHVMLRKVLLDLFAKSGHSKVLRPSVYSDQDKNTESVRAPNVTILGESTPETFYSSLDSSHIAEGLVPRFLVREYTGPRVARNRSAFHAPHHNLVHSLKAAVEVALQTRQNETCCPVSTDRHAQDVLDGFDVYADEKINTAPPGDVDAQLWNRAHIKSLKLAALVAVGCSIHQPVITKEVADWSVDFVRNDVENMARRFASGDVGAGDHNQDKDIRAAVDHYASMTVKQRTAYKVPKLLVDKPNLVPYVFLKRYCGMRASFKNSPKGSTMAIQMAVNDLVRSCTLKQIPPDQALKELGVESPVYIKGESW